MLDAYTNVRGSFGTRPDSNTPDYQPNEGGNFLISGPDYEGGIPAELVGDIVAEHQIPTNQAWLIGRMAVDAYAEITGTPYYNYVEARRETSLDLSIEAGRSYTYKYGITPLESFEQDKKVNPTLKDLIVNPYSNDGDPYHTRFPNPNWDKTDPENFPMFGDDVGPIVDNNGIAPYWTPGDILTYVGDSIDPASMPEKNNQIIFDQFDSIGLRVGQYQPPLVTLGDVNDGVLAAAEFMGYLAENLDKIPAGDDPGPYAASPWTVQTDLGDYHTDSEGWIQAAVVAAVGLGANLAEDGIYPVTKVGGEDDPLNGQNNYSLTFPADKLPPIIKDGSGNPLGYWSVTIYDENGDIFQRDDAGNLALKNPFYGDQVYSLGSMQLDNLLGEDLVNTAVKFYLQHDQPTDDDRLPYWLPVPDGKFQVMMRVYYPDTDRFDAPLDSPIHYPLPDVVKTIPEPTTLLLALLALVAAPLRVRCM